MTDYSNKYGNRAKSLWRKVYGYRSYKPNETTIVDSETSVTYSIDLNKTVRHRDYFLIDGFVGASIQEPAPPLILAEYDEGIISVTDPNFPPTAFFNFEFSSSPIIVLTVESASFWGENLQIYGKDITTTDFTFEMSAPFLGTIRYRAIYSPTYPAYATSSYTSSITASAGIASGGGLSYYTASYAALPGAPFKFLQTGWDDGFPPNTLGPDVWFTTETSSSVQTTVNFSSELNTDIHFIAFYS